MTGTMKTVRMKKRKTASKDKLKWMGTTNLKRMEMGMGALAMNLIAFK